MFEALTRTPVPPKSTLWRRVSALPLFSYYHRLFALVMACNAAVLWLGPGIQAMGLERLSSLVLINLSLATLIRQQYLINALFWLATRVPVGWPLAIRRRVAKVYHFGGLHSGAALAATGWFAAMVWVQVLMHVREPGSVSSLRLWLSGGLMALLLSMVIMALPWVRGRFHNGFERVHRFAGWSVLLVFWGMTLLAPAEGSANPLYSGTFWMLVVLSLSVALPWLRLRKVPIATVRPSGHAVIARFTHTTPFYRFFHRHQPEPAAGVAFIRQYSCAGPAGVSPDHFPGRGLDGAVHRAVAIPCVGQRDHHGWGRECGNAVQVGAVHRHRQRYRPGIAALAGRQRAAASDLVDPQSATNLR